MVRDSSMPRCISPRMTRITSVAYRFTHSCCGLTGLTLDRLARSATGSPMLVYQSPKMSSTASGSRYCLPHGRRSRSPRSRRVHADAASRCQESPAAGGPDTCPGTASSMSPSARARFNLEVEMVDPIADITRSLVQRFKAADDHQVFFEVPAVGSVPDIVVAQFDHQAVQMRLSMGLGPVREVTAVRTLRALTAGARDLKVLAARADVSTAHMRRLILPRLADLGWVESLGVRDTHVRLVHRFEPLVRWSVSVEAKRAKWREAVAQARRHLSFVNRAYIALDAANIKPAVDVADNLASFGIGLISVDAATGSAVVIRNPRARRRPEPGPQHLVGERLWELHTSGQTSGPVYPVFGRTLKRTAMV